MMSFLPRACRSSSARAAATRRRAASRCATIIEAYWKPVYKYLRLKWSLDPDEAADLTQEFFTSTLEKDVVERYDPARARFRTYLRLCLDGFASNARKAERRLKRGGGVTLVPLDFQTAEGEMATHEPAVGADVDELFYREWVRALLERSVADLKHHAEAAGRPVMFEVFARYDLVDDGEVAADLRGDCRDVESDDGDRDQPPGGDAAAVPEDRARSAARPDVERRGVRGRGRAAARRPSTTLGAGAA